MLKYTKRHQIGRSGSWPVEGIEHYESLYRLVLKEHEETDMLDTWDQCDMWSFELDDDDDDDEGRVSSNKCVDARPMIAKVDLSLYDWGEDELENESDVSSWSVEV